MELKSNDLVEMYRLMVLTRTFEEKALKWYAEGRIVEGLHPSIGQEAVGVGACYGLRSGDQVLPSLRTRAAFFVRGVSATQQLAAMCGRVASPSRGKDTSHHAPYPDKGIIAGSGIVGSSIPVSVGVALALKMQDKDNVVISFFGDGAANRGDFHEGLNLAAVLKAPIVFVCENNLYAMTVPVSKAFVIEDIAQRGAAYGMPGIVADGQDVIAVYQTVQDAIARARSDSGPTLVECKTYRYLPHHVTFKEDRLAEEVSTWRQKDPIEHLGKRLREEGILSASDIEALHKDVEKEVEDGMRWAEKSPYPDPEEAIDHVFTR